MDPTRILMSEGGERLDKVIGRGEEDELPKYEPGAFRIERGEGGDAAAPADGRLVDEAFLDLYIPKGAIQMHTMRALVESVRVVGRGELECSQVRVLVARHCIKHALSAKRRGWNFSFV